VYLCVFIIETGCVDLIQIKFPLRRFNHLYCPLDAHENRHPQRTWEEKTECFVFGLRHPVLIRKLIIFGLQNKDTEDTDYPFIVEKLDMQVRTPDIVEDPE
jgi:hypothetical protein